MLETLRCSASCCVCQFSTARDSEILAQTMQVHMHARVSKQKQTWSFQTSTPNCRVKRAMSVISCQSLAILLIGIKEVQLGRGSLIHQTGFELRRQHTETEKEREREPTKIHFIVVKLWLFSRSTHTFFPSPKHTFLPGNPATSHLSITIQSYYLRSYKRKLWSLTTCKKWGLQQKGWSQSQKHDGGIKKSARKRESEWKCSSTSHRIFLSSSRAAPTEHPRLSQTVWKTDLSNFAL